MLDTHARKIVQPLLNKVANVFIKLKITPNMISFLALIVGIFAPISLLLFEMPILSVCILWFSGFLDAVDGTVARITNKTTGFGTVMDITFDRIVEISVIVVLAYLYADTEFYFIILLSAIIISMTVFLSVGASSKKESEKTFHYQAGLAERSEGFIFFSMMMLFPKYLEVIVIVFIVAILLTALWRFYEAKKVLD